jgi:hypothetical protein
MFEAGAGFFCCKTGDIGVVLFTGVGEERNRIEKKNIYAKYAGKEYSFHLKSRIS